MRVKVPMSQSTYLLSKEPDAEEAMELVREAGIRHRGVNTDHLVSHQKLSGGVTKVNVSQSDADCEF
jgi:hypothetical protein